MSLTLTTTQWVNGATADAAALNSCFADPAKVTASSTTGGGILLGRSSSGAGPLEDIPFSTFVRPNTSPTLSGLTVSGNASVSGTLTTGALSITNLSVPGNLTAGAVSASGSSLFNNVNITGAFSSTGASSFVNLAVYGNLLTDGDATMKRIDASEEISALGSITSGSGLSSVESLEVYGVLKPHVVGSTNQTIPMVFDPYETTLSFSVVGNTLRVFIDGVHTGNIAITPV
jgi:hypothetical protein